MLKIMNVENKNHMKRTVHEIFIIKLKSLIISPSKALIPNLYYIIFQSL